ncbi:isocitrate lyase/phosphoenolpyruvate mutase family protein [Lysobacter sp. K5869]|uniref:isocitrate lyase/PEP mutase family protein n=1 Tax=Lysobacter sp. K5869 TaxID=2820808 RepID=UPI001C061C7E|nr:isocitrate lyase/phosphoenolpyruvate mutase family protein [Lysobacter sp. K5869]QWP74985.1 isocitrate lyase/phosphoenolpyruvate mutase family protein [Lysobacter sp. K5869]
MTAQNQRAETFHRLHRDGLLLLANAWDAGSARLIESLGASAVATTSAGVAWAHGFADGDHLPVPRLIATVADIARAVRVPLSVDVEGGYSEDPAAVADHVAGVIDVGAVGINIEDGAAAPELLCAKIERIKRAAANLGVALFVNARTDVYLRGLAPPERRVEETLARAARYREAGADGLFVPGLTEEAHARAIAADAGLPLNLLARAALPPAAELRDWGVRRLSAGSDLAQSVHARLRTLAGGFLRDGDSRPLAADAMSYPELNALFEGR